MSDKVRLDAIAIAQSEYDPASRAKKVKMIDTEMAINVDESEDSVATRPMEMSLQMSVDQAIDITKYNKFQLYVKTLSDGAQSEIFVEINPTDSDEGMWFRPGPSVTPSQTENGIVFSSLMNSFVANRMKLTVNAGSPDVEIYLVARS